MLATGLLMAAIAGCANTVRDPAVRKHRSDHGGIHRSMHVDTDPAARIETCGGDYVAEGLRSIRNHKRGRQLEARSVPSTDYGDETR